MRLSYHAVLIHCDVFKAIFTEHTCYKCDVLWFSAFTLSYFYPVSTTYRSTDALHVCFSDRRLSQTQLVWSVTFRSIF